MISGSNADQNQVFNDYVGTDVTGQKPVGNGADGVLLQHGANNNTIGGLQQGMLNVISGNRAVGGGPPYSGLASSESGISLTDTGTSANVIVGNIIGAALQGGQLQNGTNTQVDGVYLGYGANGNTIGGSVANGAFPPNPFGSIKGNAIAGNLYNGVEIASASNLLAGNYIGLDSQGNPLANGSGYLGTSIGGDGVDVDFSAANNVIGGTAAAGNVISANRNYGIEVEQGGSGTSIDWNIVGLNPSGVFVLGYINLRDWLLNNGAGTVVGANNQHQ